MRDNIGWMLIGALSALLFFSASYNFVQNTEISALNKDLLSLQFDHEVCLRRVQDLTAREREPKK